MDVNSQADTDVSMVDSNSVADDLKGDLVKPYFLA